MTSQRSSTPVDQDLQTLYDEVWAGFAMEEPSSAVSSERDLDHIYSVYGADSEYAPSPTGHGPNSRQELPIPSSRPSRNTPSPSPISGSGSVRRLPPTPRSAHISTPSFSMPEPDVYEPQHRPSLSSSESYSPGNSSSDMLRGPAASSKTGSLSGRRLPAPPTASPRHPSDARILSSNGTGDPPYRASPHHNNHGSGDSYTAHIPVPSSSNRRAGVGRELSYRSSPSNGDTRRAPSPSFDYYDSGLGMPSSGSPSLPQEKPSGTLGRDPSHRPYPSGSDPSSSPGYSSPPPPQHRSGLGHTMSPSGSSLEVPRAVPRRPSREFQNDYFSPGDYTTPLDVVPPASGHVDVRSEHRNASVNYGLHQLTSSTSQPEHLPPPPVATYYPSTSYLEPASPTDQFYDASPSTVVRRPSDMLRDIANYSHAGEPDGMDDVEYWEDEEEGEESFVNFSLLSHLAVQLKDKVPRGTHVKGSIPYPRAFTGKDIVSTIQSLIQRELAINLSMSTNDRRAALQVARSLQSQLFFYEVEWGGRVLQDGVEDVYMFLDDQEGTSDFAPMREELPTGVVTMLTKCYVSTCVDESPCYSYSCPRRGNSILGPSNGPVELPVSVPKPDWPSTVPKDVIDALPESEINRQTIIHKIINKEDQYIQDLDIVESDFIKPLRLANPPIISPPEKLEEFIDDVFGNILDLRECNRRLLEVMYVRQREQQYVIQRIGDVFLAAATEFRLAYPIYIGHYPLAEKRLKDEVENNPEFRRFLEQCSRQTTRQGGDNLRLDLKHFLNRPSEHLQKYPVFLEAIYHETAVGNPDADYLMEAIEAIKSLQTVAQLRTFQSAMGKGTPGKWEWHDLVSTEIRKSLPKEEAKRQSIIFELIKGEMAYVKDLENIDIMYIKALRAANPPIIPPNRLDSFIKDVFHNFAELGYHHRKLVEKFHEIQREQHPVIRTVTAAMFDAALNFRDAYMEYIPNYPIAAYRIDDEMANNLSFKTFVEQCVRHPDAHRLDMKNFINRPIPRLLRYELLLKGILDETPPGHDDRKEIPQVLEVIKSIGKDTEPGVVSAKQKVELWRYNSNLVFKHGESIDMDLLDENRSLIYSGKLLRQPDSGLEWNGWSELFVLLFDNYLVLTKPKERDGVTMYYVNRRPTPLDLLTLVNFTDPPTQRSTGLLRNLRGERHTEGPNGTPGVSSPESTTDSRSVYPLTLHHNGRMGGPYILYAESAQARADWKQKLEEALVIRKVVQESNKVFEIETLSSDTFLVPAMVGGPTSPPAWNQENSFTGKVTCSVPFNTADGRGLVAIGCAEGVWIGFRHDPKSMRRVLHLKLVTQCAMLEEFGLFLVLADKSLFAYHIEALVPSSPQNAHASQVPQKLNGNKDVHFFSVGTLHGRTLVIYMKKKALNSIFRVLEPVGEKINERVKTPGGLGSRLGFRSAKSEWFRIYRDFFLPSESFDLIFLKAKIAILCTKGFEIMDLHDFKSATIPHSEDPKLAAIAKRGESCRPIGMFRSADDEFLLCYDEFGLYVDKHGDPSRSSGTIEWEGTAERAALHLPYILLFDSRFIEVRRLETGRLVQIIPGNDVRCIWDGRGVNLQNPVTTPPANGSADDDMVQDAQVHAVMNSTEQQGARGVSRAVAQHVFELVPTVPLYPPGPVQLPQATPYQPSYSPPRSPEMRTSMSWRP
ncbi:CNH domain-containing protein [Armillaria borealis]|uniref:CNH domain-containing protein n=1 Tax=Armillaria borealis TaxID=47425 RepID=A0AA39J7N3_9AGAR|nr:CNH domain-containing protein [Armillaria borealis]